MARYTTLRSDLWIDPAVEDLSPTGKLMYVYLLTSPVGNAAGFYRIPPRQIAGDLHIPEKEILPELCDQTKLWKYDAETRQVLIPKYLKYNKAVSEKQVKGVNAQIESLQKCVLHRDFLFYLNKYCGEKALQYINEEIKVYVKELCRKGRETNTTDYILYNLLSSEDNTYQTNTYQFNTIQ